jgi:PEGA domain
MRPRPFLLLATCFASVTVFTQVVSAKPKVAVLGLEIAGDSANDQKASEAARSLTRELRREANKQSSPFELAPNSGKDLLEMKLLGDCSDEGRRCMSDIGKQLRAERLIYGNIERTRRGYAIELRLLDTDKAQLVNEIDDVVPNGDVGSGPALQRHARALFARLSGADEEGALSISANAERGTVYVDGRIRTSLSAGSARVSGLSKGAHRITIEADGYKRYEAEIEIGSGESRNLRATLSEMEDVAIGSSDPIEREESRPGRGWRIAVWGGVLGMAAGTAGWAYSGITVQNQQDKIIPITREYSRYNGMPNANEVQPNEDDKFPDACTTFKEAERDEQSARGETVRQVLEVCDKANTHKTLVNFIFIPTTAAAVLFTGLAVYKGFIAPANATPSEREAARKRKKKSRISVAPALGPDLLGAGLYLQF